MKLNILAERYRRKIMRNWKMKLTALFLAVVFWVYVIF